MSETARHDLHNCVQSLFDTLIDIREGYDEFVERAEPSIRGCIQDLRSQHDEDIAAIERVASKQGLELDRAGTLMANVHKAVVRIRDTFTDLDGDALNTVADGEETVVKRYDDAIKCLSPQDPLHDTLKGQRDTLQSKINNILQTV
ncbi:DUF2383 domain-containing protein [Marivita sp. XM-24bin2]|uniref:DUF2383 domain-containing protein n=1 Tax=unclassified Marivita TaxID=2632480 RepID=UPI0025B95E29|nr:DUF2383 domain-containing protein [Marivita sp. XM-24bin2]MCR9108871.1 PA2169 family four-helix-bundle protein [Paracoccaceae bacterium]